MDKDGNIEGYLGFIQDVITRMGQNSFQTKEWCITVVSALLAILLSQEDSTLKSLSGWISSVAAFLFCLLDTYYLYMERGYRVLYNIAAGLDNGKTVKRYDMSVPTSERRFRKYMKALCSMTTGAFYLAIIVLSIVLACVVSSHGGGLHNGT